MENDRRFKVYCKGDKKAFHPYRVLALSVVARAFDDIREERGANVEKLPQWKLCELRANARAAYEFLSQPNAALKFWCEAADINARMVRVSAANEFGWNEAEAG